MTKAQSIRMGLFQGTGGAVRSHRLDVVSREVSHLGRAVRNKSNQLLRALAIEDPNIG
jgi:hypothetical protein